MDLISLNNTLYQDVRKNEIIEKIMNRLNELKLVNIKYIGDAEFIKYLMNIIEYLVIKKDKIDKKELLLLIFKNHYNATDNDLIIIDKIVEYIFNNKGIKKVSYYKLFRCAIKEWFFKKV